MLDESENNYLAALFAGNDDSYGLVYCDISTGELVASEYSRPDAENEILNELIKLNV